MVTYLHYHSWELASKRISKTQDIVDMFDKIARKNKFPEAVIGSTIWGITKQHGKWYFTGKLIPTWVGHRDEIPSDVSEIQLEGKDQYATCPEKDAVCEYGIYGPIEGLGEIVIPKYGVILNEVAQKPQRLMGFFERVDVNLEFDDWVMG